MSIIIIYSICSLIGKLVKTIVNLGKREAISHTRVYYINNLHLNISAAS